MTLDGPDVSVYQGLVDWNAVAQKYPFAFAKATEGNGFEDPQWARNGAALAAPGPLVGGAYHFARPDLGNLPEAEADWFWDRVLARCGSARGLLLALDLEVGSGDLSNWRNRFCLHLSNLSGGYNPGWYTYYQFATTRGLNVGTNYWGWLAWPDANGPLPAVNFGISFQQYGLDPLTGGDINRFFGDLTQLKALTVSVPTLPPAPPVPTGKGDHVFTVFFQTNHHVFWADNQGRLRHLFYPDPPPAGATWSQETLTAASTLIANGQVSGEVFVNQLHVYAPTPDGHLLHVYQAQDQPGQWHQEVLG